MDRQARWILGFWLLFNLLQSAVTELFHDEAYYRVFSRFPDWGYKDHPPVTALLVAAGSELLPGEMGVRLFMVLLTATTLWMARCMVQPDRPLLFWSILLSMPLHADWSYQRVDAPGTPEAQLLSQFLVRRDWL